MVELNTPTTKGRQMYPDDNEHLTNEEKAFLEGMQYLHREGLPHFLAHQIQAAARLHHLTGSNALYVLHRLIEKGLATATPSEQGSGLPCFALTEAGASFGQVPQPLAA